METSLWGACLLLLVLVAYVMWTFGKIFRPAVEKPLCELPPQEAHSVFRYKLYYRGAAVACFLVAAVVLLWGEHRIACLFFVCMGFLCQYGVYRLRCRFPAATPPAKVV